MTLDEAYFRGLYDADPDPWRFADSDYEKAKYEATIASLAGRRYENALEVGCSIGVLTARLSEHARNLIATDITDAPLRAARVRNRDRSNITFLKAALPDGLPRGRFDLIVLSEVLYYLAAPDLRRASHAILERLAPDGDVVLVHWLGKTDYPLTGDEAAETFMEATGSVLTTLRRTRRELYRLDVLRKIPGAP